MTVEIIIVLAVLFLLSVIAPLFSPFFRKSKKQIESSFEENEEGGVSLPPVTIVITDHDNAYQLSQIIDGYLSQDYPEDYQLVVVVDETDQESIDVLNRHGDNPHLYYTKLPVSSRYLSRKKLALTIGLRAAKYDWTIISSVYCSVPDSQWLKHFCSHMTEDVDMVIGMTPYEKHTPRFWRYEHLRTMLYYLKRAERGTAFSTNQLLVAIKKELFFQQQGFSGNLEYQRAEFEFLVNKYAQKGRTAIATAPSSWLECKRPSKKQWYYRHMHSIDSFSAMKHGFLFRLLYHTDMWVMHIYNLLMLIALLLGIYLMDDILIIAVPSLWLLSQIERIIIYAPVLRHYDNVNPVLALIFDWWLSMSNLITRIRYKFTDRYDFMTHKL